MITIKILSLTITIGVIIFTYLMSGNPGFRARSLQSLATSFIILGIPTLMLMMMCLSTGKWAGFFLLCGLVSIFAAGSFIGYFYARWVTDADAFHTMFIGGMISLPIFGTPLTVALLP